MGCSCLGQVGGQRFGPRVPSTAVIAHGCGASKVSSNLPPPTSTHSSKHILRVLLPQAEDDSWGDIGAGFC